MRKIFIIVFLFVTGEQVFSQSTAINVPSKIVRSYPVAGAAYVSPRTSVGITFDYRIDRTRINSSSVTVTGSEGGSYFGTVVLSDDERTLIFTPSKPFLLAETVRVESYAPRAGSGAAEASFDLKFTVRPSDGAIDHSYHNDDPMTEGALHPDAKEAKEHINSPEGLPMLTVTSNDNPYDGRLYLVNDNTIGGPDLVYLMALDKDANVLFARQPGTAPVYDFRPQKNGTYTYYVATSSAYIVLDSNYNVTDTISAANGYTTDPHELLILPDGSYYIIALDHMQMDLHTIVPGDTNAMVLENIIQHFDKGKHLIFEWRALDHFKITDISHEPIANVPAVDYCHMNALDLDADGGLLISSRNMDEITKIDTASGAIVWRLGGKNNQFTITGDSIGFSHQHSIRHTDAGTYTIFDNGNVRPKGAPFSRALEYRIDPATMQASEIWEFRHQPLLFSWAMGSVQRLPNGNSLIGWGLSTGAAVTEVGPFNKTAFEMKMDSTNFSYRAYKFPQGYIHTYEAVKQIAAPISAGPMLCVPNPVSASAEIRFPVTGNAPVRAVIYDELGKEVRVLFDGRLAEGSYVIRFESSDLAAGLYHVRVLGANALPLDAAIVIAR